MSNSTYLQKGHDLKYICREVVSIYVGVLNNPFCSVQLVFLRQSGAPKSAFFINSDPEA